MSNDKQPKKKKRFDYSMQRANSTHVTILVLIGAYLVYMAYKMLENTRNGNSSMSMTTTIILMVCMCVAALLVFAYAGFVWYRIRKNSALSDEEAEALDKQMASADMENYGRIVGDYDTDVSDVEDSYDEGASDEDPQS